MIRAEIGLLRAGIPGHLFGDDFIPRSLWEYFSARAEIRARPKFPICRWIFCPNLYLMHVVNLRRFCMLLYRPTNHRIAISICSYLSTFAPVLRNQGLPVCHVALLLTIGTLWPLVWVAKPAKNRVAPAVKVVESWHPIERKHLCFWVKVEQIYNQNLEGLKMTYDEVITKQIH